MPSVTLPLMMFAAVVGQVQPAGGDAGADQPGEVPQLGSPMVAVNLTNDAGAAELVEAVFGPRVAVVERSRGVEDDLALRDALLGMGDRLHWAGPYERAYLAQALAIEADDRSDPGWRYRLAQRLWDGDCWHGLVGAEQMAGYCGAWARSAGPAEKPGVQEMHIEWLLTAAAEAERRGDASSAVNLLRDAERVARSAGSPYEDVLRDEQRRVSTAVRYEQQLDNLAKQLERRADPGVAKQAAVRFAIERNDYASALRFAEVSGDEELLRQVTLASANAAGLEPADALGLSQWFKDQADTGVVSSDIAKLRAYREARFYAYTFLNSYEKMDVIRLRAGEIVAELDTKIADLQPPVLIRPAGAWRDLLPAVIPPRSNRPGSMVWGQHLRVRNATLFLHQTAAAIPANPPGEYELRFSANLTHANDRGGMTVYFPVGNTGGLMSLGGGGQNSCNISGAGSFEPMQNFVFPEDRPVAFLLTVRERPGGQVSLRCHVEGREMLDWTGPIAALRGAAGSKPPDRIGRGFVFGCSTTYEITNLAYRRAGAEADE